ncbi:MAG: ABC transporter substrate-binding protein [Deltaproteobacteria bacterium]|nr:ABC transporter substrate-binding protein [Deltaproteobacteria bacterium]
MSRQRTVRVSCMILGLALLFSAARPSNSLAGDKLTGIYGAQVMSQAMLWIANEAGIFSNYNLDFQLIYIASSAAVTAAMLGGDAEVASAGGVGSVRAFVQGATDLVFIGAIKNILTQSILGNPEIRKPEDLKGKKIGDTRIGSNTHYFTVQALKQRRMEAGRDFAFIQTGGEAETLAALSRGAVDAAAMSAPADAKALGLGFRYIVYGPELQIPHAAQVLVTRRSLISKRADAIGRFMRSVAEGVAIMNKDKEFTYKVVGKKLRVTDRKILDAAYKVETQAIEPRLEIKPEGIQAILEEVSEIDSRARKVKPQDLIDRRYLDEMERSGFFNRIGSRTR